MAKFVVISGASSGLGACYARELASRESCRMMLIARREDRLRELEQELTRSKFPPSTELVVGDLTDALFIKRLKGELLKREEVVDLLINNAGFGTVGSYANRETERQLDMVRLNCLAAMELVNAVLPKMIAAKNGAIINVCSTAAYQPMPYMATYGATKAFLMSWSLALAAELRDFGITVLAQCPGPTKTEFHLAAGLDEKLSHLPPMTAEQVVKEALAAVAQKRDIIIHGRLNGFLAALNRIFSKKFAAKLVQIVLQADAKKVDSTP